jgi:hypothetical protein
MAFVAIKIGRRQDGPSRTGTWREHICSDTQSRRRGIAGLFFFATLRAAASWLFFRVALSSRINSDMLVANASPARTVLKKAD